MREMERHERHSTASHQKRSSPRSPFLIHLEPGLTMAEYLPLGLKSSRPYVSRRSARRRGNSMAARGSGGLLLCMALLLAMPALAATPADRGECAASADKPDVGGAACSRIIDDASEQVAERVKAFMNRGRGSFNGKDYDRAIADYGEAIKLSPKDAWAFAHRCEAYESKEDHVAAIADCT